MYWMSIGTSCTFRIATGAALALLLSLSAWASDPTHRPPVTEAQYFAYAGPLLRQEELPELRAALKPRLDALHQALQLRFEQKLGMKAPAKYQVVFSRSQEVNAYFQLVRDDKGETKIMLNVTEGFLRKYFSGADPTSSEKALRGIAGVLAHEFAHSMDWLDPQGLMANHGRQLSSQAIELRTDLEALMLLRDAGMEPDSLLTGLEMLGAPAARQSKWKSMGVFQSYASTHPTNQLRQSAQRVGITATQYEHGSVELKPFPSGAHLAVEVQALPLPPKTKPAPPTRRTRPIVELATEIRKLRKAPHADPETRQLVKSGNLETEGTHTRTDQMIFRRDLDELESVIKDRGQSLTPPERETVISLHRELILSNAHYPAEGKRVTNPDDAPRFFRSREYTQSIQAAVEQRLAHADLVDLVETLRSLDGLSGMQKSEPGLRDRIATIVTQALNTNPKQTYARLNDLVELYRGDDGAFLEMFLTSIEPKLSRSARLRFAANYTPWGSDTSVSGPTLRSAPKHSGEKRPPPAVEFMKSFDAKPEKEKRLLREMAKRIWAHRAEHAVVDMIGQRPVEWDVVFKLLKMDPAQGKLAIGQSVKDLTLSPDYGPMLQDFYAAGLHDRKPTAQKPGWLPADLAPYLSGAKNPAIAQGSAEKKIADYALVQAYYKKSPEGFRYVLDAEMRRGINAHVASGTPLTGEAVLELRMKALTGLVGKYAATDLNRSSRWDFAMLETIRASDATPAQKRKLLEQLFVEPRIAGNGRFDFLDQDLRLLSKHLIETGVVRDEIDFVAKLIVPDKRRIGEPAKDRLAAMFKFKPELVHRIRETRRIEDLEALAAFTLDRGLSLDERDIGFLKTADWYNLKDEFADALAKTKASPERKLALFERITATKGTAKTDRFFGTDVFPALKRSPEGLGQLETHLKSGRIESEPLRIETAKSVLESSVAKLLPQAERHAVSFDQVMELLERGTGLVDKASGRRDEWIESMVRRLRLFDPTTLALAQGYKTTNWRNGSPQAINWLSMQENFMQALTPADRLVLADYIADPRGKDFPAQVQTALEAYFDTDLTQLQIDLREPSTDHFKEQHVDRGRRLLTQFAHDSQADEKVLAIESLLTGGPEPLAKEPDFAQRLLRNHLGYSAGSPKEKGMLAFLANVPEVERPVTLAYLLSRKGEPDAGWKPIFEVFRTVGIKTGQLGGMWKLFEDSSGQIKELMDNAKPIDMAEIRAIMDGTLSAEELALIKGPKKILGSASLKVAVLMELKDGTEVVMMVRRPHVIEQVKSNLERARGLLGEMQKAGLPMDYDALKSMLFSVESQLADEIRFSSEAAKVTEATETFAKLNDSMRGKLGKWKFRVPRLTKGFQVRDNLLFMEKATGKTLNRMAEGSAKKAASRLAAIGSVQGLFRLGWFDADRHLGNWIVDEVTGEIWAFDFGQAEKFAGTNQRGSVDEVEQLASFLFNSGIKRVDGIVSSGVLLSENPKPSATQLDMLKREVKKVLARNLPNEDRLLQLVSAFDRSGVKLKRKVSFGALKGLVVISQAGLISEKELSGLLRNEIVRVQAGRGLAKLKQGLGCSIRDGLEKLLGTGVSP